MRSQVDSASTAMTVLTAFTSCCAITTLMLSTFRPPKGSPTWEPLMGSMPGERNWPTAQTWQQDNAWDGKKTRLRWTSAKVACYKGCLSQLLNYIKQVVRGPRMGRWIRGRWICVFGAPRFSVQRPQNPIFWVVSERFGAKIWGAPNADPSHGSKVTTSRLIPGSCLARRVQPRRRLERIISSSQSLSPNQYTSSNI